MANYFHVITNAQTGEVTEVPFTQEEIEAFNNPVVKQEEINQLNQKYLDTTDWYVIRQFETGVEVPEDILQARKNARLSIVDLQK